VTGTDYSRSIDHSARLRLFAATAFFLAPFFCYSFVRIFEKSALITIPAVAIALLIVSFLFGLWRSDVRMAAKIGAILWSVSMACVSPAVMILAVCYFGAQMNIGGSCI